MRSKIVIGVVLIAAGIFFALSSTNIIALDNFTTRTAIAALVIIVGIYQLFFNRAIFFGGLMISLASLYILRDYYDKAWDFLVPLILVFLGLDFILGKRSRNRNKNTNTNSNHNMNNNNNNNQNDINNDTVIDHDDIKNTNNTSSSADNNNN